MHFRVNLVFPCYLYTKGYHWNVKIFKAWYVWIRCSLSRQTAEILPIHNIKPHTCNHSINQTNKQSIKPTNNHWILLTYRTLDDKLIPGICDVIIEELKGCKADSLKYKVSLACGFFYKMFKQITETILVKDGGINYFPGSVYSNFCTILSLASSDVIDSASHFF